MTRPESRIDIINACPTLNKTCVSEQKNVQGPMFDSSITGITFIDFDNAISLIDTRNTLIEDCRFVGSLVAIQSVRSNFYGNRNAQFLNCDFAAKRSNGERLSFCLRFETPFYAHWFKSVSDIPNKNNCEEIGLGAVNYDPHTSECQITDVENVASYIEDLFGANYDEDKSNSHCLISDCNFQNSTYSAIELAGTLNTHNIIQHCTFNNCDGTAIEFDKGASHNLAYQNTISNMRPTTVFSPRIPYIFQASIQEQGGSDTANRQLNDVIASYGYADQSHSSFKGSDIYERASLLPIANQIIENRFDVSINYELHEYESNSSLHSTLPDVYPSIKITKPNQTKVIGNEEFIGEEGATSANTALIGQSILLYPNDTQRESIGGIEICDNIMHGGLFIISNTNTQNFKIPCLVKNNIFGGSHVYQRGGLTINGFVAKSLDLVNNIFYCSDAAYSISLQNLSIENFTISNNEFYLKPQNSFYVRNKNSASTSSRELKFTNNSIIGGVAINFYDWTTKNDMSSDKLVFTNNNLEELAGSSKVVGVSLWYKNITIRENNFTHLEDKIFQFYSLSDTLDYSNDNALTLGNNSQSRAYSRNYSNSAGYYITNDFWL
jgi:hypothetical protein